MNPRVRCIGLTFVAICVGGWQPIASADTEPLAGTGQYRPNGSPPANARFPGPRSGAPVRRADRERRAGDSHRQWLGDRGPESQSTSSSKSRSRAAQQRRRQRWCKRYQHLIDGSVTYSDLPYVKEFWRRALSLQELNDRFLAMKKTDKHYLYEAWKRHRHHIRAADFDRARGDKSYNGHVMGDPEILALSHQLREIERALQAKQQGPLFAELLSEILAMRRAIELRQDESRNRLLGTSVTRYHPTPTLMEGGCTDRRNLPLFTLDQFLAGKAPYVSVALDVKLYSKGRVRYGDVFWIPSLDARHRQSLDRLGLEHIVFRAVDTGNGFTNKGFRRLDLCVSTSTYKSRYQNGGKTIGEVILVKVHQELIPSGG